MRIGYLCFLTSFGDISNEQMQNLWSKILAGEIKRPNTYSLRTLNTLKNITQQEAKLFEDISKFKMISRDFPFIVNDTDLLNKYNFSFEKLLLLQDCGLMYIDGFVNLELHEGESIIYNDKAIAIFNGNMNIRVFTFSETGKQLLNLIKDDSNFDYTLDIMKKWKNKNDSVKAFKVIKINEKSIEYDEKVDLLE